MAKRRIFYIIFPFIWIFVVRKTTKKVLLCIKLITDLDLLDRKLIC